MQLEEIVFIQLQGNDILVNCQGNKFIQRTYIYLHKVSFEAIIFDHGIIFILRNLSTHSMKLYSFKEISSFKGNIFIQRNYIHSRKYNNLRKIYSFKFKAICSFKENNINSTTLRSRT